MCQICDNIDWVPKSIVPLKRWRFPRRWAPWNSGGWGQEFWNESTQVTHYARQNHLMAVRHLYETAFDSTASTADADSDPEDILETSRRLFSPEPAASIQRPSPASSRSSSDSDRSTNRRAIARSPGLPLKKIFSPWTCGKNIKGSDTPVECVPAQAEPKEEKGKTFSPSVEFKKLDVADEGKKNTMDSLPSTFSANPRASTDVFCNENCPKEAIPSTTTNQHLEDTKPALNLGNKTREIENGDCSSTATTFTPTRASREEMKRSNFNNSAVSRNNLWLDFSGAPKRPRRHLCLDVNGLADEEDVEPTAQLMKQGWYHGSISRADAENLLRLMKKGSFLVRCSEKLKRQYLLSLKSSRGVMHVKIVQLPNGKYVIKQQTQTFDSIPQLIQYFSTHILNIHEMNVYLSHPVIEKLL